MTLAASPRVAAAITKDFEYTVRLNVAIPLAWAQALKTLGTQHYDLKCKEMAKCGVVNGLYNIAKFNEDPKFKEDSASWPATHPVTWGDCDGMLKILEMSDHDGIDVLIENIRGWLCQTMNQIERRHDEITSEPDVPWAIREALRRTRFVQAELAQPCAAEAARAWAPGVKQLAGQAEAHLSAALVALGGEGG